MLRLPFFTDGSLEMKLRSLLVAAASIALLVLTVYAADEIDLKDIKCAMNPKNAAKADKFVAFKGGKVFFCCDNCPKAFAEKVKTDQLVAAKGNHQLIATKQAQQEKCPLTGRDINTTRTVTVAGAKIAFCCENCQGNASKMEGDDQLAKLFGDEAFKKAGFSVPVRSTGAADPSKGADAKEPVLKSEGAADPNKKTETEEKPLKSEGDSGDN
jgi:hypothetical protein